MRAEVWQLLLTVVSAGTISAAAAAYVTIRMGRAGARQRDAETAAMIKATDSGIAQTERDRVVVHYEGIIARLNGDLARLAAELEAAHADIRKMENKYEKEYREVHSRFLSSEMERKSQAAACRSQRDSLLDQITRLQQVIEGLRSGAEPWAIPDPTLTAWVIFDDDGLILSVGPNIQPVLGWTESDLLRKPTNIKALIPSDRHGAYEEMMAKVRAGQEKLDPREVRSLRAVCKWGDAIPIYLTLRRRDRNGKADVVATIRERYEDSGSQDNITIQVPTGSPSGEASS